MQFKVIFPTNIQGLLCHSSNKIPNTFLLAPIQSFDIFFLLSLEKMFRLLASSCPTPPPTVPALILRAAVIIMSLMQKQLRQLFIRSGDHDSGRSGHSHGQRSPVCGQRLPGQNQSCDGGI